MDKLTGEPLSITIKDKAYWLTRLRLSDLAEAKALLRGERIQAIVDSKLPRDIKGFAAGQAAAAGLKIIWVVIGWPFVSCAISTHY